MGKGPRPLRGFQNFLAGGRSGRSGVRRHEGPTDPGSKLCPVGGVNGRWGLGPVALA